MKAEHMHWVRKNDETGWQFGHSAHALGLLLLFGVSRQYKNWESKFYMTGHGCCNFYSSLFGHLNVYQTIGMKWSKVNIKDYGSQFAVRFVLSGFRKSTYQLFLCGILFLFFI
jgi:hypothetical protein